MSLVEHCVDIVSSQAKVQKLSPEALCVYIHTVFQSLHELGRDNTAASEEPEEIVTIRQRPLQSIQHRHVVCLECGRPFKLLTNRHLRLHQLTPRAYKLKWGIPLTQPLSAKRLTEKRRQIAKDIGAGKALSDWRAKRYKTI